jgi:hypothetical protein
MNVKGLGSQAPFMELDNRVLSRILGLELENA